MFILLYLGIIVIAYVMTFKNDFNPEHLEKAGPFIFILSGLLIAVGLIGSIRGR